MCWCNDDTHNVNVMGTPWEYPFQTWIHIHMDFRHVTKQVEHSTCGIDRYSSNTCRKHVKQIWIRNIRWPKLEIVYVPSQRSWQMFIEGYWPICYNVILYIYIHIPWNWTANRCTLTTFRKRRPSEMRRHNLLRLRSTTIDIWVKDWDPWKLRNFWGHFQEFSPLKTGSPQCEDVVDFQPIKSS